MPILSFEFCAFVALLVAVYYCLPGRFQSWWLLLASYAYCATWGRGTASCLALVTGFNLVAVRHVRGPARIARVVFWTAVAVNVVGLLAIRRLSTATAPIVGASFYVLQALSYLADVRTGALKAPMAPLSFAVCLAYFPKLLAGPIERARAFLPQLEATTVVDGAMLARGVTFIATGALRKAVIADPIIATIPANVFVTPNEFSGSVLAWSLVLFAFGLYNDFAGYSEIARGVSALFGIELARNFAQPFFSKNFTELWTRWHISLSAWLRDYVYLPLSRTLLRRFPGVWSIPNLVLPPLVTMFVSGLWHGAALSMIVWGLLNGLLLTIERLWSLRSAARTPRLPAPRAWRAVSTASVVVLALGLLIPFLMPLPTAAVFLGRLSRAHGWTVPDLTVVPLMVASIGLDGLERRHGDDWALASLGTTGRSVGLAAAIVLVYLFTRRSSAPFVYQGF
jgi:alginate O-acetyltransferase complex protein AlgI